MCVTKHCNSLTSVYRFIRLFVLSFLSDGVRYLLLCCLLISGCKEKEQTQHLVIGYTNDPPFSVAGGHGEPTGVFPEFAKRVVDRMGVRATWVLSSFDDLIPALERGHIDVIANGLTITEERKQTVCFSAPIGKASVGLLTLASEGQQITSEKSKKQQVLNNYAVLDGSLEQKELSSIVSDDDIIAAETTQLGALSLINEQAKYLIMTIPSLTYLMEQNRKTFTVLQTDLLPTKEHSFAFGFNSAQKNLVKKWNKAQHQVLRDTGLLAEFERYGFELIRANSNIREGCSS